MHCLDIGARKKVRKVTLKTVRKVKDAKGDKKEDHKNDILVKSHTVDSDATVPFETFPSGGDSQWRQEAEDQWDNWRWPPVGWKPSQGQRAYHDESSDYYRFNNYDWDGYEKRLQQGRGDGGEPTTSPGSTSETPSTSLDRRSSLLSEVSTVGPSASLLAAQFSRSRTGDMSLLEKFDQVAAEETPENVMKIALQEKARAEELMKKAQDLVQKATAAEEEKKKQDAEKNEALRIAEEEKKKAEAEAQKEAAEKQAEALRLEEEKKKQDAEKAEALRIAEEEKKKAEAEAQKEAAEKQAEALRLEEEKKEDAEKAEALRIAEEEKKKAEAEAQKEAAEKQVEALRLEEEKEEGCCRESSIFED